MPRQAIGADRLALRRGSRWTTTIDAEHDQHAGEHQREIARPHAQRRAELERQATDRRRPAPSSDEDRAADAVGGSMAVAFHGMSRIALHGRSACRAELRTAARRCHSPCDAGDERRESRRPCSVGVLAGGLDDRLPARDLGFELGLERRRRRVGLGRRRGAELGEARDDVRVLERRLQRLRQPLDRPRPACPSARRGRARCRPRSPAARLPRRSARRAATSSRSCVVTA